MKQKHLPSILFPRTEEELIKLEENEHMDFKTMIRRDRHRWEAADVDKNGNLDYEEFVAFIHPEERENMFDIVIDETMEDIDKNQDGTLSVEEYIGEYSLEFKQQ